MYPEVCASRCDEGEVFLGIGLRGPYLVRMSSLSDVALSILTRMTEAGAQRGVTIPQIQITLGTMDPGTTIRGITSAIQLLENNSLIHRIGMNTYSITAEGRRAAGLRRTM